METTLTGNIEKGSIRVIVERFWTIRIHWDKYKVTIIDTRTNTPSEFPPINETDALNAILGNHIKTHLTKNAADPLLVRDIASRVNFEFYFHFMTNKGIHETEDSP